MRTLRSLLFAATVLAPLSAFAMADPNPGPRDGRIRTIEYDQKQVTRLVATQQIPMELIFSPGEKPAMIAGPHVVVDPKHAAEEGWFAKPSGNSLLLTPLRVVDVPVLFVRTVTAEGTDRHYTFELHARPSTGGLDGASYLSVQFLYKADPDPDALAAAKTKREEARESRQEQLVAQRLAVAANYGPRNTAYERLGDETCPIIGPIRAFDDGVRTSLVFTPNTTLPEIYVVNQDGKRTVTTPIASTSTTGLQMDVPGVYRNLYLRRGDLSCAIRNKAYDSVGIQPGLGSGTIAPDVMRVSRR